MQHVYIDIEEKVPRHGLWTVRQRLTPRRPSVRHLACQLYLGHWVVSSGIAQLISTLINCAINRLSAHICLRVCVGGIVRCVCAQVNNNQILSIRLCCTFAKWPTTRVVSHNEFNEKFILRLCLLLLTSRVDIVVAFWQGCDRRIIMAVSRWLCVNAKTLLCSAESVSSLRLGHTHNNTCLSVYLDTGYRVSLAHYLDLHTQCVLLFLLYTAQQWI